MKSLRSISNLESVCDALGVQFPGSEDLLVPLVFSDDLAVVLVGMRMSNDLQVAVLAHQSVFIEEARVFAEGEVLLFLQVGMQSRDDQWDVVIAIEVDQVVFGPVGAVGVLLVVAEVRIGRILKALLSEVLVENVLVNLADIFLQFVGFGVINLLGILL